MSTYFKTIKGALTWAGHAEEIGFKFGLLSSPGTFAKPSYTLVIRCGQPY